ncbi:MAG: TonB-dependent receptor domain-containing protein [Acidobacteriota bacterium]
MSNRRNFTFPGGRALAVLILLSLCLAVGALAQTSLSTIRGTVTDETGGVIPGLEVTVTEKTTNVRVRSVVSDDNGNYEIPDLKPGIYQLKAELPGFKTFVADDIILEAGAIRRIDIHLQVGEMTDEVTVTAGAAVISTDSGGITESFDEDRMKDSSMPASYPSPFAIMSTLPGVQGRGWQVTISGQDNEQMSHGFDGVSNDRTGGQSNNLNFFEGITVVTVNATADQSRVGAYNMTSKRGTNDIHGKVYYQHYNSGLEARKFFEPTRTPFIQHEWQIEAAGPIIQDRTFFYAAWLGQRFPLGSFRRNTVPTLLMQQGDFSQLSTDIIDPLTGEAFPNNIIPPDRMSPVALKIQELYIPKPNLDGPDNLTNNFGFHHDYPSDLYRGDWPFVRVDHKFSDANTLYGRFLLRRTPYVLARNAGEIFAWTRLRNHYQTVFSDTHVFSPGLVNTFKFGWSEDSIIDGAEQDGYTPIQGNDVVEQVGLQGVNPRNLNEQGFPRMDFSGFTSLETIAGGVKADDTNLTFDNVTTWATGRHVFKFGAQVLTFEDFNGAIPNDVYGRYRFNGFATNHSYADFLLGIPFQTQRLDPLTNRLQTQKEVGIFLMDTFKLTPKLTLDYGLRWDYYGSPRYEDGLQYNWDPDTGNVVVPESALSAISPLYPDSINIVTGEVIPQADKGNFRPRLGVAYRLQDDTVIRGGYGSFTERIGYFEQVFGGGPFQIGEVYRNELIGGQPLFQFPNPFPGDLGQAIVPSQDISGYPLQTDEGVIHQFNLSVEREISDIGFRISYVGSRNRGMHYELNINKPRPSQIDFDPSRKSYPQFVDTDFLRRDGKANYDSLQVQAEKKVGALTFNAHWTWANNMLNYLKRENPYDVTSHWARDDVTRRHRVVVTTMFDLPWGRGRRFLSNAGGVLEHIVGGWRAQTASILASGEYFSPSFSGSDPSNTDSFGGLPDRIAGGNLPSDERTVDRWFNPDAFAVPPEGSFGNSGVNILEGQGMNVHHLSLAKTFSLSERFRLTYTAAISNLFNHPHFNNIRENITASGTGAYVSTHSEFWAEKASHRRVVMKLRLEW